MASVFGHALLAGTVGVTLPKSLRNPKVFLIGILCSIMPDIDILSFRFGISYGALWGHRGMTHSILFGLFFGLLIAQVFHFSANRKDKSIVSFYYILCTVSHGILDGLTTGGKGVAYFSPFDPTRYFLPWKVIQVSPLGAKRFFSQWGLEVIISELFWIGLPCFLILTIVFITRKVKLLGQY